MFKLEAKTEKTLCVSKWGFCVFVNNVDGSIVVDELAILIITASSAETSYSDIHYTAVVGIELANCDVGIALLLGLDLKLILIDAG